MRVPESVDHFLQACPALADLRAGLLVCLQVLLSLGHPGRVLLAAFCSGGGAQLSLLLGARWPLPYRDDLVYREQCAQAWWIMDKNVKNYVMLAWRKRERFFGGRMSVAGGFNRKPVAYAAMRNAPPLGRWEPGGL